MSAYKSGREQMPMGDRVGLLAHERIWLEMLPGSGMEVHDKANLLEVITLLTYCWTKTCRHDVLEREISQAECLVMAWKRGGHQEYQRIKKEQSRQDRTRI